MAEPQPASPAPNAAAAPTGPLAGRRIVVLVSGGIAAYKAADLVSRLRKAGAEVRVAMTASAREFVAPLTFETLSGSPVYAGVFERPGAWEMEHIGWARWAEALVAAPATANLLAKLAHGLADDAPTTLALAFTGPLWIAPAMNTAMWAHPATQHNLEILRLRGVRVIEPESGALACGEVGPGRMAQPESIAALLVHELAPAGGTTGAAAGSKGPVVAGSAKPAAGVAGGPLAGKTVLITTGPTREALDPIRFISNRSTGRMGTALAAAALERGARVLLVHGHMDAPVPPGCETIAVGSAREMLEAVQQHWKETEIAIFAAAVANYEAGETGAQKIKGGETLNLVLRRTPDIAAWCGAHRREGQRLVGFCAESEDLLGAAARKLAAKQLDFICANWIGRPGVGFAADDNEVALLGRDGTAAESPRLSKRELADWIWEHLLA